MAGGTGRATSEGNWRGRKPFPAALPWFAYAFDNHVVTTFIGEAAGGGLVASSKGRYGSGEKWRQRNNSSDERAMAGDLNEGG